MESNDFKTTLEVALHFFPGIKLKRENRNCASKACLSNEKTSSSGFCRLGKSDWLFHLPALSIGQKTELSLLRVFVELLQLYFHKYCLPLGVTSVARSLASNRNWTTRTGCRRCLWPGALEAINLTPSSSALLPANASRNSANIL